MLAAALLVLSGAGPASAHDQLRTSDPADGAVLASAPSELGLVFSDPVVALGSQVVATGPDGADVAAGEPDVVDATVTQPLAPDLAAGDYVVQWRVTSSDGHPISGTFAFTVEGTALSPSSPPVTPPVTPAPVGGEPPQAAAPAEPVAPAAPASTAPAASPAPAWPLVAAVLVAAGAAVAVLRRRRGRRAGLPREGGPGAGA